MATSIIGKDVTLKFQFDVRKDEKPIRKVF